jgi:hypothetical protein
VADFVFFVVVVIGILSGRARPRIAARPTGFATNRGRHTSRSVHPNPTHFIGHSHPDTAEHLRRKRTGIERLLGLLAHRYGARKSRYIGSAKAGSQAAWAAALVNLNPIGHRLASHPA